MNSPKRRQRTRKHASRREWWREYRQRIEDGLERCRNCFTADNLTFDHIVSNSDGGRFTYDNTTILCQGCNSLKGVRKWPHLKSFAEEEAIAALNPGWSRLTAPAPVAPKAPASAVPHLRQHIRKFTGPLTYRPFETVQGTLEETVSERFDQGQTPRGEVMPAGPDRTNVIAMCSSCQAPIRGGQPFVATLRARMYHESCYKA